MPEELNDRAQDNWRSIIAIADLAGHVWAGRARGAAVVLSGGEVEHDDDLGMLLLADLRDLVVMEQQNLARSSGLLTSVILSGLSELTERPWPTFSNNKLITPMALGKLLRPFGIQSTALRYTRVKGTGPDDQGTALGKGYRFKDLAPLFEKYLPAIPGEKEVTGVTTAKSLTEMPKNEEVTSPPVTSLKTTENVNKNNDVTPVTSPDPVPEEKNKNLPGVEVPKRSYLPPRGGPHPDR
jgi:hypothetical protein